MREIRKSGSMSGDGKRDQHALGRPEHPRLQPRHKVHFAPTEFHKPLVVV